MTRLYPFSKNREGRVRKPFAVNADIFEISVNQLTGNAVSPLFAVSTLKMDKVESETFDLCNLAPRIRTASGSERRCQQRLRRGNRLATARAYRNPPEAMRTG